MEPKKSMLFRDEKISNFGFFLMLGVVLKALISDDSFSKIVTCSLIRLFSSSAYLHFFLLICWFILLSTSAISEMG